MAFLGCLATCAIPVLCGAGVAVTVDTAAQQITCYQRNTWHLPSITDLELRQADVKQSQVGNQLVGHQNRARSRAHYQLKERYGETPKEDRIHEDEEGVEAVVRNLQAVRVRNHIF